MNRRCRLAAALSVVPLTLALTPAADAGKRSKPVLPRAGIYSAEPIKPTADFLLGTFAVVRDKQGTRIVAVETKPGIYYPNVLECGAASLPLRREVVPVKPNGQFKVRDSRPTLAGRQVVRWSGRWVRPGKVRGQIRIKVKNCKTTYKWKARRLPPGAG